MGKMWPYIGLAVAVAVGVALAPYIGGIALAILCIVVLIAAYRIIRRFAPVVVVAVTFFGGAVIVDRAAGSSAEKQWVGLLLLFAAVWGELLIMGRLQERWRASAQRDA